MAKRIAVFASGNGSNFQVIAEQFPVEFVFSDLRDAYVLERAEKLCVLTYSFELKEFENKADYEGAIVELLDDPELGIDWQLPTCDIILSPKDREHPRLREATHLFDFHTSLYEWIS